MLLYDLTDAFQKAKVPFAIAGGYALALHGIVRATMDVDLILNLSLKDFEKAEAILLALGLKSRHPIRAQDVIKMREEYIKNRKLLAWSFVDYSAHSKQVDILIIKDLKDVEVDKIAVAGRKLPVISLKTLLEMKLQSDRPQDRVDVTSIKEVLRERQKS